MNLTRIRGDMGDSVPRYYSDSAIAGNIFDRESDELWALNATVYDVLDQFFIDTATWGLANWERVCNITVDETKPYDQRRSVIKAKLRGIGTVTVSSFKNVAESFGNGDVAITETSASYTIDVKFVSTLGIPPNLPDIQAALRNIVPAHLAITYTFTYVTWNDIDARNWTWDYIDSLNKTWDAFEIYRP